MTWLGVWKNQYGSLVTITSERDGRIEGTFESALEDSAFHGQTVPLLGVHQGNCISFASVGSGPAGDMVVSYTGLRREDRLETLWFYAVDAALTATQPGEPATRKTSSWWKAVTTNADTFVRAR